MILFEWFMDFIQNEYYIDIIYVEPKPKDRRQEILKTNQSLQFQDEKKELGTYAVLSHFVCNVSTSWSVT